MTVLLDMLDATASVPPEPVSPAGEAWIVDAMPWPGAAGCSGPVCAFTSETEAQRYRDMLAATIRGYDFHVRGDGIPLFDGQPPESFGAEWACEDIRHWRAINPVTRTRGSTDGRKP